MMHFMEGVQKAAHRIGTDAIMKQMQSHNVSASVVADRIEEVLNHSLRCEREEYIQKILIKLQNAENDKEAILSSYQSLQGKMTSTLNSHSIQKIEYESRIAFLEKENARLKSEMEESRNLYNEKLKMAANKNAGLCNALAALRSETRALKSQLDALKQNIGKWNRTEMRYCREVKSRCIMNTSLTVKAATERMKARLNRKVVQFANKMEEVQQENSVIRENAGRIMEIVWSLSLGNAVHPVIDVADPSVDLTPLRNVTKQAILRAQDEIVKTEALKMQEIVTNKDNEISELQRKSKRKVDKLRARLVDALKQIPASPQKQVCKRASPEFDEIETLKDQWKSQKRTLDAKMKELGSIQSLSEMF